MKKTLLIISLLFLININAADKTLGKVLTPAQKQEYNDVKMQLQSYISSIPLNKQCGNETEQYLKNMGTPIALRLLENLKELEKLSNEGDALFTAKKYNEASNKFTEAILIDEDFPWLWERRGACYFWLQNYQQALHDYNRAILLHPRCGFFYICRALCYQSLGNEGAAINETRIASALGEPEAQKFLRDWISCNEKK